MEALVYLFATGIIGFVVGGILEAFTGLFASVGNRIIVFIENHDDKISSYIRRSLDMELR